MSAKEKFIVGLDLGGTNIVAGAMPVDGSREIAMHTTPTLAEGGAGAVVDRIAGLIEKVVAQTMAETGAKRSAFLGVGIGSPGALDCQKGNGIVTPHPRGKKLSPRGENSSPGKIQATPGDEANF